ncbi:MAG: 3'-5' exonuclease [Chloroflexi bacterium]|nr:3'-5' exonuclease [Chloroflexota bacterium]
MDYPKEQYISVDIETSGPIPGKYAMLSIGACTISEPRDSFYIELKPDVNGFIPEALAISQLSMNKLHETGIPAKDAMLKFSQWVLSVVPAGFQPVFTAFNAPFDWIFVNDYFHRYLGYNPFGHKALDIKALYMGLRKTNWNNTSYDSVNRNTGLEGALTHHALEDAVQQAKIFEILLDGLRGN